MVRFTCNNSRLLFLIFKFILLGIHSDAKDLFGEDFSRYGIECLQSYHKDHKNDEVKMKKLCHLVRLGLLCGSSGLSWSLPTTVSVLAAETVCREDSFLRILISNLHVLTSVF